MSSNLERCTECGTPKSGWLGDNCPICLMRLGDPDRLLQTPHIDLVRSGAIRRLENHELIEEIGRGGMGVVYRARQVSLNRTVAVKVLIAGQFANETFIKRFRREAELAASLKHPNIVAIHEVGEHEGQPYFSMELIEGRSLAGLSRGNPLPARQAAELLKTIAEAIHFAHERGLLHRDLKPSNVLVDELGAPHITDFGLAKRIDGDADLTLTGQVLGSPNYMAPEQASSEREGVGPGSDVYSLGAILYHLLTGRPPFMADTVTRTLQLVVEGELVSPRLLNPDVPRDLETTCIKCLERDSNRRYVSARELADDLGRFLRDEPIRARPIGSAARLVRWCRRKPALATSMGVGVALLLVIAIGSPIAIIRINGERKFAESARKQETALRIRAEGADQETRQQLYRALLEQARATVRSREIGQRVGALDAVRRAAAISNSAELRREAFAALALPDLRFEREWPAGPRFTLKLMDPTFENVALCRGRGPIEIHAVSDWRRVVTLPASTNLPVYAGWWSSDGRYLAVKRDYSPLGERADLEVWEVSSARRILVIHDMARNTMSFHPQQHRLIVARFGRGVTTWDLESGKQIARFPIAGELINVEFAPDGERFVASHHSADGSTISIHNATTGALEVSHTLANLIRNLAWHPSGRWVATADQSGMVHMLDAQSGEVLALGHHMGDAVWTVFSPDGNYLITGGWDGELICWDMRTRQRTFSIRRKSWTAQFSSDGRQCAVITELGIQLYAFERPNQREFAEDLGTSLRHASLSPDGRWLAASADRRLGVWDLVGNGPGALSAEGAAVRPFFSAGGQELFGSHSDNKCFRWRIMPGTNSGAAPILQSIETSKPEGFTSLYVVSNLVAVTGTKGSRIVGFENGATAEAPWVRTSPGINGVSPDGRWLCIYRPFTPSLYVYRLPGLERVAKLGNRANIGDFAFSPMGDEVAVSSRMGVEFWSTNTWTRTHIMTNFIGILFSPDGRTCWLTKDFHTAGLYDAHSLTPLLPLPTGTLPLALSADGCHLAVSVNGRQLQVWDLREVRSQLRGLGADWDTGFSEISDPKR